MNRTEQIKSKIKELKTLMKESGEDTEFFNSGGTLVIVAAFPEKERTENIAAIAGRGLPIIKSLANAFERNSKFKDIVKTALEAGPMIEIMDMLGNFFYKMEKEKETSKTEKETASA